MSTIAAPSAYSRRAETIDKDQFERLLAGESEESVFPDETPSTEETPADAEEPKRRPQPKPIPRPFPGATMQPPPEGAKG
jgi:hypothetical protein